MHEQNSIETNGMNTELLEELQRKYNDAEREIQIKNNFLANMSHEIRTPLNAILGLNEAALRECTQDSVTECLLNIQKAGQSLLSIINDILDFSKNESVQLQLVETDYETVTLMEDAVNLVQSRADQKKLKMILNIDPDLPVRLRGDTARLRQILANFLSNSVKYTREGSVSLIVSGVPMEDGRIGLKCIVKDTGIGIREEDMGKLFKSFCRLDLEANRAIEGTGLGLAITEQLIQAMKGTIAVRSEYGMGSEFETVIPQVVVDAAPVRDKTDNSRRVYRGNVAYQNLFTAPEAKVLIVDDNDLNLMVVRSLLKQTKVQVMTCTGALECMEEMKKTKFDMIFMDHMMPGIDGIEALRLSRTLEGNKNVGTPMIALTANAVAGMREKFLQLGFDEYLVKPIDSKQLENIMLQFLPEERIAARWNPELGIMQLPDGNIMPAEEEEEAPVKLVDTEVGLKYCAGLEDVYKEIAAMYVEESANNLRKLKELFEARSWKEYAVVVHALKSTSQTIGASSLGDMAQQQETDAKNGGPEDVLQERHYGLLEEYRRVLQEVQRILREELV